MEQSEIIRMAQEAGLICESRPVTAWIESTDLTPYLTRFAALVAAHEREKCAKLVETTHAQGLQSIREACAAAIRARRENGTT